MEVDQLRPGRSPSLPSFEQRVIWLTRVRPTLTRFSGLAAIAQTNSELKCNDDALLPGLILNLKCQWVFRLVSIDVVASCENLGCCVLAWLYRGDPEIYRRSHPMRQIYPSCSE